MAQGMRLRALAALTAAAALLGAAPAATVHAAGGRAELPLLEAVLELPVEVEHREGYNRVGCGSV